MIIPFKVRSIKFLFWHVLSRVKLSGTHDHPQFHFFLLKTAWIIRKLCILIWGSLILWSYFQSGLHIFQHEFLSKHNFFSSSSFCRWRYLYFVYVFFEKGGKLRKICKIIKKGIFKPKKYWIGGNTDFCTKIEGKTKKSLVTGPVCFAGCQTTMCNTNNINTKGEYSLYLGIFYFVA